MRFLDACNRRPVDATPIWIMRQAGRYLPEYRAIKEKLSFIEMCEDPATAAEVTLQPLKRFELDAAIIFADILLPLTGMGIGFHFAKTGGPVIEKPVRSAADVAGLRPFDPLEHTPYLMEAIKLVRAEVDGKVPLIGFSGAPFTLASYIVEGGGSKNYEHVKTMMFSDPGTFITLMEAITEAVVDYLNAQIDAGAQVVQLFDSWVGCLSPYDYQRFALPYVQQIIARVKGRVPIIYFANGATSMLTHVAQAGADVYGVDWRIEIDRAWDQIGHDKGVQGNLDPLTLFGSQAAIEERVQDILDRVGERPGHIFNLGHGILPTAPIDNVKFLVDTVHRLSARS